MEFETVIKLVIAFAAAVGIPVGAYAAIAATRAIWIKGEPGKLGADDVEALRHRLDFTERLLAQSAASLREEN